MRPLAPAIFLPPRLLAIAGALAASLGTFLSTSGGCFGIVLASAAGLGSGAIGATLPTALARR